MPRQSRIDAPGALHHVIVRGNAQRKIFFDDKDRDRFLERFGIILNETDTACYAWALLPNHFHLLLKTGSTSLSTVMRRFLTGYAVSFNKRYKRWGHLFQNRYKSILCQEEAYLLELVRYIHLNPLRARLTEDMKELGRFKYCGHGVILGRFENDWQDTDYILKRFGALRSDARREYRMFVAKGIARGKRPELTGGGLIRSAGGWSALKNLRKTKVYIKGDERILGDGDFVQQSLGRANEKMESKYRLRAQGYNLEKIAQRVSEVFDIPIENVFAAGKNRETVQARSLLCYWAVKECGMAMVVLAKRFEISSTAVGQSILRGERIATEKGLSLMP
ncbi:MAG: transposase [Desulfobacterales bacterium]